MIRRILTALIEPITDRLDHVLDQLGDLDAAVADIDGDAWTELAAVQVALERHYTGSVVDGVKSVVAMLEASRASLANYVAELAAIRTALGRHAHPQFTTVENVRGLVIAYDGEREQTSLAHQAAGEVSAEMGAEIQRLKAKLDEVESALLPWRGNIIPSLAKAVRDLVKERQNYAKAVDGLDGMIRARDAERTKLEMQLAAERDCGQEGVFCVTAPGCARHWAMRNRQLVEERDLLGAKLRDASTEAERLAAQLEEREDDRLTLLAIREKLTDYVVKNRLAGQKLTVVVDHVLADARAFRALVTEPTTTLATANASAIAAVDRGLDLRAAGWRHMEGYGWLSPGGAGYYDTADAHARMLADKTGAKAPTLAAVATPKSAEEVVREAVAEAHTADDLAAFEKGLLSIKVTPRDTLADPQPGDLYVDRDGDPWLCCRDERILTFTPDDIAGTAEAYKLRSARPDEAAKIRKDNGL